MYNPETGIFELEEDKPLVLLLGAMTYEGIISTLQSSNMQYKHKLLESKPENWLSITNFFDKYKIECVLTKITPHIISLIIDEDYQQASQKLLSLLSKTSHIAFIYEDILSEKIDNNEWRGRFRKTPTKQDVESALKILKSFNINLTPYKRNAEITILSQSFLSEIESNLIFRIYVPSGKMWAIEGDKLLLLFKDYLTNIGQLDIRLDQQRTDKGIVYEFHGKEKKGENGLASEFNEFKNFMDLCANNQDKAEALLIQKNIDKREIYEILSRYGKEAKRLQVDIKHERERRLLNIKQRLESELADNLPVNTEWGFIEKLANEAIPKFSGVQSLFQPNESYHPIANNLTINLNPQIIDKINGVVAQEINGNQNLGVHGEELIQLINKHAGNKSKELTSAVYEIEDQKVPRPDRLKASQKLKSFLIEAGKKTSDVAFGVLQTYIENQLGL